MTNDNDVAILHRSKHFLVVDKPYDMVINSNDPKVKHSLQEKIRKLFPDLINPKLRHDFHFVHRLDYATSGVICVALHKLAAKAASTAFECRKVRKYYLALVHGHIVQNHLIICEPIGEDIREQEGSRKMCTSSSEFCQKPRESLTALLVLERGYRGEKPATKVLLYPKTGRRHQLRVHCDYINHTIIGDYTYSCKQDVEPYRTFLHSYRIILDNDVENLDVRTCDPFSSTDCKNQWRPTNFVRPLDDRAFSDISTLT